MKKLFLFILSLILLAIYVPKSKGFTPATLYVGNIPIAGVDTGNCQDGAHPCLTLDYATRVQRLTCGDTLYVRGGTYDPPSGISGSNYAQCSGWNLPVIVSGFQSEIVNIVSTTGLDWAFASSGGVNTNFYWILTKMNFVGHNDRNTVNNLGIYGANHIQIVNVNMSGAYQHSIDAHPTPSLNTDIQVRGGVHSNTGWCTLGPSNCSTNSNAPAGLGACNDPVFVNDCGDGHDIYIGSISGVFENLIIHDFKGYGIQVFDSASFSVNDNIVRNNLIYNGHDGIIITTGSRNVAYNNQVYGIIGTAISIAGSGACGDCALYNNSITTSGIGIGIGYTDTPGQGGAIRPIVENNISYGNSADIYIYGGYNGLIDHNLLSVAVTNAGQNYTVTNNPIGNPLWASAPANMNISSGPAVGTGLNLSSIFTTDLNNQTRPAPATLWDKGAFQSNGTPTASIDTITPSSGGQGSTVHIVIIGVYTHFDSTTRATFSGSGVSCSVPTINSVTSIECDATITGGASAGARTVTVTTNVETPFKLNGFTVVVTPLVSSVSPPQGSRSSTQDITVIGINTTWDGTSVCSVSGTGVSNSLTQVVSSTALACTLVIASNATLSARDVIITTGSHIDTGPGMFLVVDATEAESIYPSYIAQGAIIAIVVTGQATGWYQVGTVCSAGSNITISSTQVIDATHAVCNVIVGGGASLGARNFVMTTDSTDVVTLTNGLTIIALETEVDTNGFTITSASQATSGGLRLRLQLAR